MTAVARIVEAECIEGGVGSNSGAEVVGGGTGMEIGCGGDGTGIEVGCGGDDGWSGRRSSGGLTGGSASRGVGPGARRLRGKLSGC